MNTTEIDRRLAGITFTRAVVGMLIDKDKVCLGVRKKVSGGLGQDLIAGIGGKVGDAPEIQNETAEQAMDREAKEEIGVDVLEKQHMGRVRFIFSHKAPDSKWNQDVEIYTVTKWRGEPKETESTKPEWFATSDIPWVRMWEDNQHWIPLVLAGQVVNAIFLFSEDNKIAEFKFITSEKVS